MNIDVKKILDQAKDSYDRYFKDAPKLPENHGQDVVFDKEKMKEIINKKVNQLEGHVNNLNTLKKELEGESATVLNNTFPKDKEEYYLVIVNDEISRLTRLINDLLDLSAMQAGKLEFNISELELNRIIETTVLKMNQKAASKNIKIEVLLESEKLFRLYKKEKP